jgi:hypothetical protein
MSWLSAGRAEAEPRLCSTRIASSRLAGYLQWPSPACHLGLGKLYAHTGKRELAQEHLTAATTMYREMGMTYWLEKAEAEMKDEGD